MFKLDRNKRQWEYIKKINIEYTNMSSMSTGEIANLFQESRDKVTKLAAVKHVVSRETGLIPYDEQLLCALSLIDGKAVEMRTGEGKSLAALIAALYLGYEKKTYIATVNEYLAKRDYTKFKHLYEIMGISVSFSEDSLDGNVIGDRLEVYTKDVVYASSSALIFDYLRSVIDGSEFALDCVIIDEVDFILLDNATSSFSVSIGASEMNPFEVIYLRQVNEIIKDFKIAEISYKVKKVNTDYLDTTGMDIVYNKVTGLSYITAQGEKKLLEGLGIEAFTDDILMYKSIVNMVEAYSFHKKGIDYIVQDGKVKTINKANGRANNNSRLGLGMHNAIEAKEGVEFNAMGEESINSSYQVFYSKFKHICGMSGTIMSDTAEFGDIYGMNSIMVPLHNEDRCTRHKPIYFRTSQEKYEYAVELIREKHEKGQPVLVICENEAGSELMSRVMHNENIKHNLLNNSYTDQEERIIEESGQVGVVTISTSMAGRGTDIVISKEANELGGLFVLAMTNYPSVRVENQVKGRAGRQGFHGEFAMITSMEDEIWHAMDLADFLKITKVPNDKFYSKIHQLKVGRKLKGIQEFHYMRDVDTRKRTYYTQNIIEAVKHYLFNYSANINSTEDFIKSVVSKEILQEEFLNTTCKAYKFTLIECTDNEKAAFISNTLLLDLEYTSNKHIHLIKTLYDNNIRSEWYLLQNQLEDYSVTILTNGNYNTTGQSEFIRGAKKIVDGYMRSLDMLVLSQILEVKDTGGNN